MEYVRSFLGRPTKAPVASAAPDETLQVPYLGDMNYEVTVPVPGSGYDRARWFAEGMDVHVRPDPNTKVFSIGTSMRGIDGELRDAEWTDGYFTGYIDMSFPDNKTLQADDVGSIWQEQTQATRGLNVPGNDQVYVDQDTQTVWTQ